MLLTLKRQFSTDKFGTLGRLSVCECLPTHITEVENFASVEQPWRDNQKYISCIPTGTYTLVSHNGSKRNAWAIVNHRLKVFQHQYEIPDYFKEESRFACLVHVANVASQLQGCVAIGLGEHKYLAGNLDSVGVVSSGVAQTKLHGHLARDFAKGIPNILIID